MGTLVLILVEKIHPMSGSNDYIIGTSKGRLKRLRTWFEKNRAKDVARTLELEAAARDQRELRKARTGTSIVRGLIAYGKMRKLTQTQLADELGITRRTVSN